MKYKFLKKPQLLLLAVVIGLAVLETAYFVNAQETVTEQETTAEQETTTEQETTAEQETTTEQETETEQETTAEQETTTEEETKTYTKYEKKLLKAGFPESYLPSLVALHKKHPNWEFVAVDTGLEWDTVIDNETVLGRNVVPGTLYGIAHYMQVAGVDSIWYPTPTAWKSLEIPGAYDWSANQWTCITDYWVQASREAVEYIMDPRNWMTENNVFMFEQLSYNESISDEDYLAVLTKMVDVTFMDTDYATVSGTKKQTYAQVILEAGKKYNVSPISLCARIIQEKGRGKLDEESGQYMISDILAYGVVTSDGGKTFHKYVKKTDGDAQKYYNFFNIGASGKDQEAIINNGGREAYNAGWTNRYLAIMGGASKIASSKINVGQDTLYFQKFSVVNEKYLYWNQYMQNLLAPTSEGFSTRKSYEKNGLLETNFTFRIPVYNNMPETACENPSVTYGASAASPNNKLKGITIAGTGIFGETMSLSLEETFSMDCESYTLNVPYIVNAITIEATPIDSGATVQGAGTVELEIGTKELVLTCTSAYGTEKTYRIQVTRSAANTTLSQLTLSAGDFSEPFLVTQNTYEAAVTAETTSTTITYVPDTEIAVVVLRYTDPITGEAVTENLGTGMQTTHELALSKGEQTFYLDIYPHGEDLSICTTYSITVYVVEVTATELKELINISSCVRITWEKNESCSGYFIWRYDYETKQYQYLATVTSYKKTYYDDTTANESGRRYRYRIQPYYQRGSAIVCAKASMGASTYYVARPSILTANSSSTGIRISWTKDTGAKGYQIYRREGKGEFVLIGTISKNKTTAYTDTNVVNGRKYQYIVKSYLVKSGVTYESKSSSRITTYYLKKQAIRYAKQKGTDAITMRIVLNKKASGYEVQYWKSNGYSEAVTITETNKSKTTFTLTGLQKGKRYYIRVRSYKTVNGEKIYSAWSDKTVLKIQ